MAKPPKQGIATEERVPMMEVRTAGRDSFWRAGFQFTREPRVLYADELSDEAIEAISTDPALVATRPAKA